MEQSKVAAIMEAVSRTLMVKMMSFTTIAKDF